MRSLRGLRTAVPLLLIAVLPIAGPSVRARATMSDFAPIPLDRLIGTATLIVLGDVAATKKDSFRLRVTETLAGRASPEIEVRPYIPSRFEGTPRPAPYRQGQSFLLFLVEEESHPQGPWKILGSGGEGEMPVEEGFVYFHGRNVEGLPFGRYRVHEADRNIQRFDARAFVDAVERYRECFEWKPGSSERSRPASRCDQATLDELARTSPIHRHLVQLTARRSPSRV